MQQQQASRFQIGAFAVDLATGRVERGDHTAELNYRAREALRMLIDAQGEVVRREDLFERLWPQTRVDETSLTKCIAQVRQALGNGNGHEDGSLVETIPRIGYRLRVAATALGEVASVPPLHTQAAVSVAPASRRFPRAAFVLAALLLLGAVSAGALHLRQSWLRSAEAEKLFEEGKRLSARRDPASAATAVRLLEQAISLAPDKADWYAHLAQAIHAATTSPAVGTQPRTAVAAARRGIEIDPKCIACQISYGFFLFYHQWSWEEGERHLRIAESLSPGHADANANLAMLLAARGKLDEALQRIDASLKARPFAANWHAIRASVLYFQGRHADAIAATDTCLGLHRDNNACWDWRSRALHQLGRNEEAVQAMADGPYRDRHADIENAMARGGYREGLRALLRITDGPSGRKKWMFRRAVWHLQLGDRPAALEELEFGTWLNNVNMAWVMADPTYRELSNEPRYRRVLETIGLNRSRAAD